MKYRYAVRYYSRRTKCYGVKSRRIWQPIAVHESWIADVTTFLRLTRLRLHITYIIVNVLDTNPHQKVRIYCIGIPLLGLHTSRAFITKIRKYEDDPEGVPQWTV